MHITFPSQRQVAGTSLKEIPGGIEDSELTKRMYELNGLSQTQWYLIQTENDFFLGATMDHLVRNGDEDGHKKGNLVRIELDSVLTADLSKGTSVHAHDPTASPSPQSTALARGILHTAAKTGDKVLLVVPDSTSGHVGLRTTFKEGLGLWAGASSLGKTVRVDVVQRTTSRVMDLRLMPRSPEQMPTGLTMSHHLNDKERRAIWGVQCVEACKKMILVARRVNALTGALEDRPGVAHVLPETVLQTVECRVDLPRKTDRVGFVPNEMPFSGMADFVLESGAAQPHAPLCI